jgi:exopolysaccharide biosynthesis polyprenyl glycosylphosphotransferase
MADPSTDPHTTSGTSRHAPKHGEAPPILGVTPLMTRLNEHGFRLVQAADVLAILVVLIGTISIRSLLTDGDLLAWPTYSKPLYAMSFLVTTAIFAASLYFGGLYEREPRLGRPPVLPRAMRQTLAAGGLVALLNLGATGLAERWGFTTQRALPMPTLNLVILILASAVAVAANRRLSSWMRTNREGPPRVFLVGAPDDLETAMSHLRTDQTRAHVVAASSDTERIVDRVDEAGATDVVLLASAWLDSLYPRALQDFEARGVSVLQRVTAKETMFGLERVRQIGGLPFVLLRPHAIAASREHFKRFTDLLFLMVLGPVFVPLLALVTLYQFFVVGRPILFWQERVGARGKPFRMVKFRTMYANAEEDGNPRLASQDDPRIIPACKWLRATRLDELPQIYNVMRGEMSLVGPRPERPELTAQFERVIPGYARRHELPPGLTGLAQIHGRYHTDPEYKLGYDLQYLVNWSPVLDLEIIARTVWVVLTRKI